MVVEITQEEKRILVLADSKDSSEILSILGRQLPFAKIEGVPSLVGFRKKIIEEKIDIIILDLNLTEIPALELMLDMKLAEHESAIINIIESENSELISNAYNAGSHRCIIKAGQWQKELLHAVRYVLRIKRLEKENAKLIAKLTEANSLLAEKNKRLSDFTGTVAHDIRGPLGGINMKLEYICDIYKDDVDPKLAKLLVSTFDASERLLGVVQAMYEFAKIGVKSSKMEMIDLTPFIQEVVQDLNLEENSKVEIQIEKLPQVWGNPPLLRKVFINLINNAIKYNDKEKVKINIFYKETVQKKLGDFGIICVSDNGLGIPQDEIADLFIMFRRGRQAEKRCEGVGIGLSVVKQIVELHYGNIDVESTVGTGTTFLLTLPIEEITLMQQF